MKLLYIVPSINNAGGVSRVLSIKTNYFIEKLNYEVHILTQNDGNKNPFYQFNSAIRYHDISLKGTKISFFNAYKKQLLDKIKSVKPDLIIVCDNGLKAFTIPFFIKNTPTVFEIHGSRFVEEKEVNSSFLGKAILQLKYRLKTFGANQFTKVVALSKESLKEWKVKNAVVIPNPTWITSAKTAALQDKKVIAIARNSYEKGLDRLLEIWQIVIEKNPDWTLEIYTDEFELVQRQVKDLGISSSVHCNNFTKNIEKKYSEASIFAMTSRTEGFPMVLLEAMSLGLPCLAFDCPTGPRAIIENNVDGVLVTDGVVTEFAAKMELMMTDENWRTQLGISAKIKASTYSVEKVMKKWEDFLETIISK